jgi:hypothetical protein
MVLRPSVENLGECGGLAAACGQIPFEHEYEHDIAFGGEVHDVLGNNRPALPPGGGRHVYIFGCSKADLGDMNSVVTVGVSQEYCGSYWKHLIDQKGTHVSSASRCSDV